MKQPLPSSSIIAPAHNHFLFMKFYVWFVKVSLVNFHLLFPSEYLKVTASLQLSMVAFVAISSVQKCHKICFQQCMIVLNDTWKNKRKTVFCPGAPLLFTLTMCSFGSRLQSARVSSSPSRKRRLENFCSSMMSASISSGKGLFR